MLRRFILCISGLVCFGMIQTAAVAEETKPVRFLSPFETHLQALTLPDPVPRFAYDSGYDFTRPDTVRGIYATAWSAGGSRMEKLIDHIHSTELNTMVIDLKGDSGIVPFKPENKDEPFAFASRNIMDPEKVMKKLEKNDIYPIARIVCFKDGLYPEKHPEASFKKSNGQVWKNGKGEAFINPFMKQTWDYNVSVAIAAAKMGFQEIQFDYVRFPEGFEHRDDELTYSVGDYENGDDNVKRRVTAVTDFVQYAREKLKPYNVDVSVDIFGYTATLPAAPGIGQNFSKISEHVDVISSMIYPSHWTSYFGIRYPDLHPYELVTEYMKVEKKKLGELDDPPISRPWIQDFTASWLSHYQPYGAEEVEAQIRALNEHGVDEFLIWDANNSYTEGVDYTPLD